MHQKGTKRFPDDPKKTKASQNIDTKRYPDDPKKTKSSQNKDTKEKTDSKDFLEMRKEIVNLKRLLQTAGLNGSGRGTPSKAQKQAVPPMMNHMMHPMMTLMNQGIQPMMAMNNPMMTMNHPMMTMNHPMVLQQQLQQTPQVMMNQHM
jgi:hypothetical protein